MSGGGVRSNDYMNHRRQNYKGMKYDNFTSVDDVPINEIEILQATKTGIYLKKYGPIWRNNKFAQDAIVRYDNMCNQLHDKNI